MEEFISKLTTADYVMLGIILLFGIRCVLRGFVKEVFSLAGLVGGVVLARFYYEDAAAVFLPWVDKNQVIANVLGFAAIVIVVSLTASLAGWAISKLIGKTFLGVVDRLAGLAVGVLQGVVLIGLVLLLVEAKAGTLDNTVFKDSVVAGYILEFMKFLSGLVTTAKDNVV